MPIISNIGHRSWHVRTVFTVMFALLITGSITMIYPLLLMFSGSFRSDADSQELSVLPKYWFDDDVLYRKYVEARYALADTATVAHQQMYASWRQVHPVEAVDEAWVAAWRRYRDEVDWPTPWFKVAQCEKGRYYRLHARGYREMMYDRFDGNLDALSEHYDSSFITWQNVYFPLTQLHARRYRSGVDWPDNDLRSTFTDFKRTIPKIDRVPMNIDGVFWNTYLRTKYSTVEKYNDAHGTGYTDYRQVLLDRRAPAGGKAREDWELFVRDELNLNFIRLDPRLAANFRIFLARPDNYGDIGAYNRVHSTDYDSFDDILLPTSTPTTVRGQEDLSVFIGDSELCDLEALEVYGPRQHLLDYLEQTGALKQGWETLPLPLAETDYIDLLENRSAVRWEEIRRNYVHVIDFVVMHGRSGLNTLIYCSLLIAATLLVNPLAAYALSRYKPPSQYKIILICMATMAFPAEVTMVPAFLLIKKFPLWNLVTGVGIAAVIMAVGFRALPKASEAPIVLLALGAGILGGWWLAPSVAVLFGHEKTHTSLLNTFAALVLPAMANGYGLFLLKGFFDSLPREIYESADIDGASEWTKFWMFTMALSKPILAVLALGAFTAAYSEFMMALIIIPDRDMWTLMVWLFQFQLGASQSLVQASVLIAAIPTFFVFIFCQNIIIRGIVVPVEK